MHNPPSHNINLYPPNNTLCNHTANNNIQHEEYHFGLHHLGHNNKAVMTLKSVTNMVTHSDIHTLPSVSQHYHEQYKSDSPRSYNLHFNTYQQP